jgi:hypothetical protein
VTGAAVGVVILLAIVAIAAYVTGYARGRANVPDPTDRDPVTDEVMSRLVDDLRETQAEVEQYRRTVERLQQERDGS